VRLFFIAAAFVAIASSAQADVIVEFDADDAGAAGTPIDDTRDIASTAAALASGSGALRVGSVADPADRGNPTAAAVPPLNEPEPTDGPVPNILTAVAANGWLVPVVTIGLAVTGLFAAATVRRRSRRRRRRRRSGRHSSHRHHQQTVHSHKVAKSS
jgi:hypothetical protein